MAGFLIDALQGDIESVIFHDHNITSSVPPANRMPWGLVVSIPGGGYLGPMSDEYQLASWTYQIDALGMQRQQTEWLVDKISEALIDRNIDGSYRVPIEAPLGFSVSYRELHSPGGMLDGGTAPNGTIFHAPVRFTLWVSPS